MDTLWKGRAACNVKGILAACPRQVKFFSELAASAKSPLRHEGSLPSRQCATMREAGSHFMVLRQGGRYERNTQRYGKVSGAGNQPVWLSLLGMGGPGRPRLCKGPHPIVGIVRR